MKAFFILILLGFTLLTSKGEEMLSFYGSHIDGVRVKYKYPLAKVEKLPEWNMRGETPIPFDQAVKKAWVYIEKKYPKIPLFLEEVELDPRGYPVDVPVEQKKVCWVYRFEFVNESTGKDLPGILIMLMDGTILEPTPVETK